MNITELDFQGIKTQLKDYLKNQARFKDYNFEGSNMSVLLDVLAYNSYQNNFYTNMAINEMFLDSAQLENSVVSHAKELNYLPRSTKSARATVRVSFPDQTTANTVLIPKGTRFTAAHAGTSFLFTTAETHLARRVSPELMSTDDIEIFEGTLLTAYKAEGFYGEDAQSFKCVLSNATVDTDSIEVTVDGEEFRYSTTIFGVGATDKVFYLEPYFDGKYAVVFGRNIFGLQPTETSRIQVVYRTSPNGPKANGASRFTTSFRPSVTVETITPAIGGSQPESLDSIKFFAPKAAQIQNRAVTASDYSILLKQEFQEIDSVIAYGGDELDPPQYGKVAISVKLRDSTVSLTESAKTRYTQFIKGMNPIGIQPIFIDPAQIFVKLDVTVNYVPNSTTRSLAQLESLARTAISAFNEEHLDDFDVSLRLSKLSAALDAIDSGIVSSSIVAKPIIEYRPTLYVPENPQFEFGIPLYKPYPFQLSKGFSNYKPAFESSVFDYQGICSSFQDDGEGNIQVITATGANKAVLNPSVGSIDYDTGSVKLVSLAVRGYAPPAIRLYATPIPKQDITVPKNAIMTIRGTDVVVNMVAVS